MTDATSRARRAIVNTLHSYGDDLALVSHEAIANSAMIAIGDFYVGHYDTRTHAAIAREPSEEVVERVSRAIESTYDLLIGGDIRNLDQVARAAIAALVQTQTQGGEPDV